MQTEGASRGILSHVSVNVTSTGLTMHTIDNLAQQLVGDKPDLSQYCVLRPLAPVTYGG